MYILNRCEFFFLEIENIARRFDILDRNTRQYRRYNAVGRQIAARLIPPSDNSDPVTFSRQCERPIWARVT